MQKYVKIEFLKQNEMKMKFLRKLNISKYFININVKDYLMCSYGICLTSGSQKLMPFTGEKLGSFQPEMKVNPHT